MTAHLVITNGVRLVRCEPCGMERVAPPRTADRLIWEHNNSKHKEK